MNPKYLLKKCLTIFLKFGINKLSLRDKTLLLMHSLLLLRGIPVI